MSVKTDTRKQQLLDQQLALSAYLDALLNQEPRENRLETDEARADAAVRPQPAGTAAEHTAVDAKAGPLQGVPEWAQCRFQALLFEVAGLTLAVPLVKLKGVVPNAQGLTPMPGHSPLFLGIVPYQGLQSKVVDTARFVLPRDSAERLDGDFVDDRASHLVMIDEGRWALACRRIGDVVELDSTDVKWRTASGKRPWLAGTVIERMCALLDIDQLTEQLVEGISLA
jgi:purine-binding chemotaxis protein CheW